MMGPGMYELAGSFSLLSSQGFFLPTPVPLLTGQSALEGQVPPGGPQICTNVPPLAS